MERIVDAGCGKIKAAGYDGIELNGFMIRQQYVYAFIPIVEDNI